jgi:hypothetical protein
MVGDVPKCTPETDDGPLKNALDWLRGKVVFSDDSIEPVGEDDWELLKAERHAVPEAKKRTTDEILDELDRMVLYFDHSTDPVGEGDWEALE